MRRGFLARRWLLAVCALLAALLTGCQRLPTQPAPSTSPPELPPHAQLSALTAGAPNCVGG